jgi:hypothetical protein
MTRNTWRPNSAQEATSEDPGLRPKTLSRRQIDDRQPPALFSAHGWLDVPSEPVR